MNDSQTPAGKPMEAVAGATARPYTGRHRSSIGEPAMSPTPTPPKPSAPPVPQDQMAMMFRMLEAIREEARLDREEARREREAMEKRLTASIGELKAENRKQYSELKAENRVQREAMEKRLTASIAELRAENREIRGELGELRDRLNDIESRLKTMDAVGTVLKEQRDRKQRLIAWLVPATTGLVGMGLAVAGRYFLERFGG